MNTIEYWIYFVGIAVKLRKLLSFLYKNFQQKKYMKDPKFLNINILFYLYGSIWNCRFLIILWVHTWTKVDEIIHKGLHMGCKSVVDIYIFGNNGKSKRSYI